MPRFYPIPAMIAVSALMAAPVLAQTQTSPASSPPAALGAPPASTAAPPAATAMSAQPQGSDTTYVTADQQIRASKLIGSSVYNDRKEKIGSIDELLVGKNDDVNSVVLSVGGFLGIDAKLVKVPYKELHVAGDTIVMSGATKDQLKAMPTYKFSGTT